MMGTYRMLDLTPKGRAKEGLASHDAVGAPSRPLRADGDEVREVVLRRMSTAMPLPRRYNKRAVVAPQRRPPAFGTCSRAARNALKCATND